VAPLSAVKSSSSQMELGVANVEDRAFVDEVGQAIGAGFLVNFDARLVALGSQELAHAVAHAVDLLRRQDATERQIPIAIELLLLPVRERVRPHAQVFQYVLHAASAE
jgi:hypothetical protein